MGLPPDNNGVSRKGGGQECPPSVGDHAGTSPFFDPRGHIDRSVHRLPHWQQDGKIVFLTWRLADSLPRSLLAGWEAERDAWAQLHPKPWDRETEDEFHRRFSDRIEEWLDQGMGSCMLRDSRFARIIADGLEHFEARRYSLASYVVMPNHVHVLFLLRRPHKLRDLTKSWKGCAARAINKRRGSRGSLWQEDYWDRIIRSEAHFARCSDYIRNNPVNAGLHPGEYILYESSMGPLTEGGHSCPPFHNKEPDRNGPPSG